MRICITHLFNLKYTIKNCIRKLSQWSLVSFICKIMYCTERTYYLEIIYLLYNAICIKNNYIKMFEQTLWVHMIQFLHLYGYSQACYLMKHLL
jgi:hypothetical protein